jgi:tetratricopeptide (TPR) repeat protein
MEIDPAFPVAYSGMARLHALKGELRAALRWIDEAIERASSRAFYLSRKGLFLLQLGETTPAFAAIDAACGSSPDNAFDADLVVAMNVLQADQAALTRIAEGRSTRKYSAEQRAQAHIALGNHAVARALYDASPPDPRTEIRDVLNDEWIWRLAHVVNYAHLRIVAGEAAARRDLEDMLAQLRQVWDRGGVNVDTLYWAASAEAVLGRREPALRYLEDAVQRGWRHGWWARLDWNLDELAGDARFTMLLARGSTSVDG